MAWIWAAMAASLSLSRAEKSATSIFSGKMESGSLWHNEDVGSVSERDLTSSVCLFTAKKQLMPFRTRYQACTQLAPVVGPPQLMPRHAQAQA